MNEEEGKENCLVESSVFQTHFGLEQEKKFAFHIVFQQI